MCAKLPLHTGVCQDRAVAPSVRPLPMLPTVAPVAPDARGEILRRLIDGRLRPGERIAEQRLADDLGLSRTPVREALAVLQAQGHVHRTSGAWTAANYSPEEVDQAFDVRAELEGLAAYRAAERADRADVERLRRAYGAMQDAYRSSDADPLAYAQAMTAHNRRFHDAVLQASRNRRLATAMGTVVVAPLVLSAFAWYTPEERLRSDHAHGAIADAIAVRDARRAQRLMTEHIHDGRDVVLRSLAALGVVRELADVATLWDRLSPSPVPEDGAG